MIGRILAVIFAIFLFFKFSSAEPWISCWKSGGNMQQSFFGWMKCDEPTVQETEK